MTVKHPLKQKPKMAPPVRTATDRVSVRRDAIRGDMPETMTRRASLTSESFNAENMTVEAVISTFADVTRRDARGVYIERLDPNGLDTSSLVGAPLLDGHRQGSARDVIGVLQSSKLENGVLTAIFRLSQAEDAAPVIARISEGTLRGVSIGYRVNRWIETIINGARVRTAAAWSIFETSAVPVPADSGSKFRTGEKMEDDVIENAVEPTVAETRAAIRLIGRSASMTTEAIDDMIDRGVTETEARAEAFEAMQARSRNTPRIRVQSPASEDPGVRLRAMEEGLFVRVAGGTPSDAARPYVAHTLRDHARDVLTMRGISTVGMDSDELFRAAMHTTSDFPQLLQGVGNRTLMPAYQAAQSPLKALARQSTMSDFRKKTMLKLSDVGLLEKVNESGEIKHTTRGEASEGYALETYGSLFAISRKALINDDLGAFRDWGATAGRMAAETEANLLIKLLLANPTMGEDNKKLFHADHGNLDATAFDPDAYLTALATGRKAMRNMKALDGKTPINAVPKYLVVGPELETQAEMWLAQIYAATMADVNAFSGKLTLVVEPRITDSRWYLFADPAVLPVLEYSYLSSAQGPQMSSREGWDVLGMEFRVVLDFGAGAVDWRGAYAKVPA